MSQTQCYEWFKHLKEGRVLVTEDPRPRRPSSSTNNDHVERVHAVIYGDCHLTAQEVSDEVEISIGSCHQIFTDKLQMHHVSAKCLPRLLTNVASHPQLSGKTSDICCAPSTLISRLSPSTLFPVSQT
jgi:hypothetical protein